ncbi:MAG: hypothetical protein IJX96_00265 [Clostridia bacterium]|nr:hypothetical protein [Clostridia bacterium]
MTTVHATWLNALLKPALVTGNQNAYNAIVQHLGKNIGKEATLFSRGSFLWMDTWEQVDTNAYFFQQTVNLDFDIIDVTFSNGTTETVIPVVANPIDVVPDATSPVYTQSDKEPNWWIWVLIIIAFVCARR